MIIDEEMMIAVHVTKKDVKRLLDSYQFDYLRWQATRDPGDQPNIDSALDEYDFWSEQLRRFQ